MSVTFQGTDDSEVLGFQQPLIDHLLLNKGTTESSTLSPPFEAPAALVATVVPPFQAPEALVAPLGTTFASTAESTLGTTFASTAESTLGTTFASTDASTEDSPLDTFTGASSLDSYSSPLDTFAAAPTGSTFVGGAYASTFAVASLSPLSPPLAAPNC